MDERPRYKQGHAEEDRISRLPDAILIYMLSLIPTRYSIRTSILSKRWKHLWAFAPKLDFELHSTLLHEHSLAEMRAQTFVRSIDNLLILRDQSYIECFHLSCWAKIDSSRPTSWIRAVLMCDLTELDINIWNIWNLGELPSNLFTSKTLVVVKIVGDFVLSLPYYACLPNLNTLHLDRVTYSDDASIQRFLSGCPVLEDLQLMRCDLDRLLILDASFSQLKRLTLGLICPKVEDNNIQIRVDAPNLEFIELKYFNVNEVFMNVSSPSIVEARVGLEKYGVQRGGIEYGDKAVALLRNFANVRHLYLCGTSCRSIMYAIETQLPTFHNLVQLGIDFYRHDGRGSDELFVLLDSCPKLEALSLLEGMYYDFDEFDFEYCCTQPERVPECLLHSLKSVQFEEYGGNPQEIEIVTYLLKNALVLEKMTISCIISTPNEEYYIKLERELTDILRGSTDCQLVLLNFNDSG